jgi:TatD DNase family protein
MPHAIDTHAHLNDPRLLPQLEPVLARAHAAGLTDIIVVGYDVASSETAVRLAQDHPGLWATVGLHPHDAEQATPETRRRLRELARSPRVVAIGETGLDFYRDLSPRQAQRDAMRWHLDLAREFDLPVVLHSRETQEELLAIVAEYRDLRLNWHCFDGTPEHAAAAVALGMHLGFGGMITYQKAEDLRRALVQTPLDHMLLETDAPYLAPKPNRRRDNEPDQILPIGDRIATLRGEPPETVFAATTTNARRLFRLPPPAEAGGRP